jgi:hypothetical protein
MIVAALLAGCEWDHGEPCASYGRYCDGNRVMVCNEGLGFFEDDEVSVSEDCGALGAICVDPATQDATCVLPDSTCDGVAGCRGDVLAWCVDGRLAASRGQPCDHGCEAVVGLTEASSCIHPGECDRPGEVTCADQADSPNQTAAYRICQRSGWVAEYRCSPPGHHGNPRQCDEAVLHVKCWADPPVVQDDTGTGDAGTDDAGTGG